jgi:hypothetical protein
MYVKVPKDINEYEHKVFKGLTMRNIKWGIVSIIIGFALFFLLKKFISITFLSWICMFAVIPTFVFGFLTLDDIPADKYMKIVLNYYMTKKYTYYENDYDWNEIYNERRIGYHDKKKRKKSHKKPTENDY